MGRNNRKGWNVYLSAGTCDRPVRCGLASEGEAREMVRSLNAALPPVRGVPPWTFYFCHHGNYVTGARDRGLDRWIDGEAPRQCAACGSWFEGPRCGACHRERTRHSVRAWRARRKQHRQEART